MAPGEIDCTGQTLGDVDGNGFVEAVDALVFTELLLQPWTASEEEFCAANTNADFTLNGGDIQGFVEALITP